MKNQTDLKVELTHAVKEAEETDYWLILCKYAEDYPFEEEVMYSQYKNIR